MKARLITCSVPSTDIGKSTKFYEGLIGVDFGRSVSDFVSYYAWASAGVKLTVNDPKWQNRSVMLQFAVEDLGAALSEVVELGGKVLVEPFDLPIHPATFDEYRRRYQVLGLGKADIVTERLGVVAIIQDPAGNNLGLMQLEPYAEAFFENGRVSRFELFSHEQDRSFAAEILDQGKSSS